MDRTRQLLLLRHAKSSWDDVSLADFDRPLSPRGLKAAPRMGAEIARRGWLPDRTLVSPAARTRQTFTLASGQWPHPLPPAYEAQSLYEASAETILAQAQETPGSVDRLLIVGHNPCLEDFACKLAGPNSSNKALRQMTEKFPTCGLAHFEIEGDWNALAFGAARLMHFLTPKTLG